MRVLLAAYFSVVITAGVLVATGLVPDWGRWYSNHLAYRWQTEALLSGSVSIGTEARYLVWDKVWANGNVQQAWGLGVPFWRLPFEAAAGVLGLGMFPDRIAFGVAWASVVFLLMRLFVLPGNTKDPMAFLRQKPEAFCAFVVLALFPPLLTMCRFRFVVYEEAAAYSFLAGMGLFAGTLLFFRRPTLRVFLVLAALAGLAPFVRPTLLAYGVTTMLVISYGAWRLGWSYPRMAAGLGLFALGSVLLFASNHVRFGAPLEFGHGVNLNTVDSMRYTSRFDHPFRSEPPGSAAVELTSALFVAGNTFTGYQWYAPELIPGQSSTHRWREFYFKTYDVSFALMLVIAWGWGIWGKGRGWRGEGGGAKEKGRGARGVVRGRRLG